jgi:serine/threonine-protein kinase RsbW
MTNDRLSLRSQLSEIRQLHTWVERLASQHSISASTQFAMELCLEEVVSNIIRHGYADAPDGSVTVQFTEPQSQQFILIVEDQAAYFNPLDFPTPKVTSSPDEVQRGGHGITLMRKFADSIEYQRLPGGNRLLIGFRPQIA